MLTPGIHLECLGYNYQQYYIVWSSAEAHIPVIFDNMGLLGTVYRKWVEQQKRAPREGWNLKKLLWRMRVLA